MCRQAHLGYCNAEPGTDGRAEPFSQALPLPSYPPDIPSSQPSPPDTSHTMFNNVIFSVVHHLQCATIAPKHWAYTKTAVSNIWMCLCRQQYSKIHTHTELDHSPATTKLYCFFRYDSLDKVSSLSRAAVFCKKRTLFLAQETGTVTFWVYAALFAMELLALGRRELLNRQVTI